MERRLAAVLVADMAGYSRLMELDEDGVIARQKRHRSDLIDPEIAARKGRIVKTTGDGLLAEFTSAQDAVRAAMAIQDGMIAREGHVPADTRITYRVGINLGDIVFDDGDIFGDGVNVAARLQTVAEPGGVCISDIVHQAVSERVCEGFRDLGRQRVKNISRPIRVWQWAPEAPITDDQGMPPDHLGQQVRFATSADGTRIAWADIGRGSPVLKAPNWLNHIEYEWQSPSRRALLAGLAERCRLVRFDQRGNGLSDRNAASISLDAMQLDMQAVIEAAALDRFALLGISQGGAFSIRYAHAHPGRVSCIVIVGGYLRGRLSRPGADQAIFDIETRMIEEGWGSPNPTFRHFFTTTFMPDAPPEQASSFDELQRVATDTDAALAIRQMNARVDVTDIAREVEVPTLVLHAIGDRVAPIEEGRHIARTMPNASFVELPGANHLMLEGTPAFERFLEEVGDFLDRHAR